MLELKIDSNEDIELMVSMNLTSRYTNKCDSSYHRSFDRFLLKVHRVTYSSKNFVCSNFALLTNEESLKDPPAFPAGFQLSPWVPLEMIYEFSRFYGFFGRHFSESLKSNFNY